MKLYEIAADYENFMIAVENGEIPEDCITDTLESIQSLLEDKADNIACMIKNLTAEAEAIKAEEKRLEARRKAKENQAEWYKKYLSTYLLNSGCDKLETARNRLFFINKEKVNVSNEKAFIEWAKENNTEYLTYSEPKINKTAISKAISQGVKVDGAEIVVNSSIQIK